MANWWADYILRRARRLGVRDPKAALAVARVEGLSGAVGDSGTSYGPFQLHVGGALPAGRGRAWAESKAGIDYALRRIGSIDANAQGKAAIANIVRRFERPADPTGEISRAIAQYGGRPPALNPIHHGGTTGGTSFGHGKARREALAQALIASNNLLAQGVYDPQAQLQVMLASREGQDQLQPHHGDKSNYGMNIQGGAKGGAAAMLQAIAKARKMGLSVRENPYVDPVDPVHVTNSYHYRNFPGRYNGRKLGEAIDVSGSSAQMMAFAKWLARNRAKEKEEFYNPLGKAYYQPGHDDHVHVAY